MIADRMDWKDKTVTVRIHLDRQEKSIIHDVRLLLRCIKEAAGLGLSPLKPGDWGAFDRCFKVHDLRRSGKKWREIAEIVFPGDRSDESAKGKVRSLYRKAEQMIEEEGRRI
jgi:hypothetical protein